MINARYIYYFIINIIIIGNNYPDVQIVAAERSMTTGLDAWSIVNQTIMNMNDTANAQYNETVSQINAMQSQSMARRIQAHIT